MTGDWIAALVTAHRTGKRCRPETPSPETLAEAYAIQSGVQQALGAVAGFKAARKPGEPMIYAPLLARGVVQSDAEMAVRDQLGIELEVGLMIDRDLPANTDNLSAADVAAYVTPVVVIELVDTRLDGGLADHPMVKLADNLLNVGLVVGERAEAWSGADLGMVQATLYAGSDAILGGTASVPGGSALETFAALARMIGTKEGGLRKGQIVITGSLHPMVYVPGGTVVRGEIAGIGSVQVNLI